MSRLGEFLLRRFCLSPSLAAAPGPGADARGEDALAIPREVFTGFDQLIRGKRVADFGCGWGYQSAAMLAAGALEVLCVELAPERNEGTRALLESLGLASRAQVCRTASEAIQASCDLVLSLDAMEHYGDPAMVLREMHGLLKKGGLAMISFGPPWYSPFGAHVHYFAPLPWVHLLFTEETVLAVRSDYRKDGAHRYEDVEGGLNRMSLRKFESLIAKAGFRIRAKRYDAVKGLRILSVLPLLREFFVNRVSVVLEKI
jgi:2-polyprenyl-3-methyl-5-hydroxy-6-metoxy-1,4-benzoquinol methylase